MTEYEYMTESELLRLAIRPVINALWNQIREQESFNEKYGGGLKHFLVRSSDEPSKRQYVQMLITETNKENVDSEALGKILSQMVSGPCPCDELYDRIKEALAVVTVVGSSKVFIEVKESRTNGATFTVKFKDKEASLDIESCIPSRILAVILLYKYKKYETDKLLDYDEYFELDKVYNGNQDGVTLRMTLLKDKVRKFDVDPWNFKNGKIDTSMELSSVEKAFLEIYDNTLIYNNRGKASGSIIKTIWGGQYYEEKVCSIYNKCKSTWKKALENSVPKIGLGDRPEILFDKDTLSVVIPPENIIIDESLIKCLAKYI